MKNSHLTMLNSDDIDWKAKKLFIGNSKKAKCARCDAI
jgi:hypothetical protein